MVISEDVSKFHRNHDADLRQVKDLAICAQAMGVKQLIVAVNFSYKEYFKDSPRGGGIKQEYGGQDYLNEMKDELGAYLRKIGFPRVIFVPVGATEGYNIDGFRLEPDFGWSRDGGHTIYTALRELRTPRRPAAVSKPLRISIVSCYRIHGIGIVYAGKIETGVLKKGAQVCIFPAGYIARVSSIMSCRESKLV